MRKATLIAMLVVALLATAALAHADLPPGGALVATIPVTTPRDVESGFGSIWVANGPSRTVTRIDPTTDAMLAVIPVPDPASVLAAGAGAIWVTSLPGDTVTRIDPTTNAATGSVSLAPSGLGPIGITVDDGYVWIANHDGNPTGSVAKIDPATMSVVDVIPVGSQSFAGPNWLAAGAGSIWTDVPNLNAVVRINPATDAIVATVPDKGVCGALAASDTAVWVAGGGGPGCLPGITRIDPNSNTVTAMLNAGGQTDSLALGGGTLWYGTSVSNFLGRVDTTSNTIVGQLKLRGAAFGLTAAFGYLWSTDRDDGLLLKVQPT
jgi:DNA-binding beta-propeller fold protein YncE